MSFKKKMSKNSCTKSKAASAMPQETKDLKGVYANTNFVDCTVKLMGKDVIVHQLPKDDKENISTAIFSTVNDKGQVLCLASCKEPVDKIIHSTGDLPLTDPSNLKDTIYSVESFTYIEAKNINLQKTDGELVSENGDRNVPAAPKNSGPGKTFHQWEGDKTSSGDEVDDYLSLEEDSSLGWDPDIMFQENRDKFGVKSTYNSDLPEYTTALVKDDSKEYQERKARATKIAQDIENTAAHQRHASYENCELISEEQKYSSVHSSGDASGGKNEWLSSDEHSKVKNRPRSSFRSDQKAYSNRSTRTPTTQNTGTRAKLSSNSGNLQSLQQGLNSYRYSSDSGRHPGGRNMNVASNRNHNYDSYKPNYRRPEINTPQRYTSRNPSNKHPANKSPEIVDKSRWQKAGSVDKLQETKLAETNTVVSDLDGKKCASQVEETQKTSGTEMKKVSSNESPSSSALMKSTDDSEVAHKEKVKELKRFSQNFTLPKKNGNKSQMKKLAKGDQQFHEIPQPAINVPSPNVQMADSVNTISAASGPYSNTVAASKVTTMKTKSDSEQVTSTASTPSTLDVKSPSPQVSVTPRMSNLSAEAPEFQPRSARSVSNMQTVAVNSTNRKNKATGVVSPSPSDTHLNYPPIQQYGPSMQVVQPAQFRAQTRQGPLVFPQGAQPLFGQHQTLGQPQFQPLEVVPVTPPQRNGPSGGYDSQIYGYNPLIHHSQGGHQPQNSQQATYISHHPSHTNSHQHHHQQHHQSQLQRSQTVQNHSYIPPTSPGSMQPPVQSLHNTAGPPYISGTYFSVPSNPSGNPPMMQPAHQNIIAHPLYHPNTYAINQMVQRGTNHQQPPQQTHIPHQPSTPQHHNTLHPQQSTSGYIHGTPNAVPPSVQPQTIPAGFISPTHQSQQSWANTNYQGPHN